MRGGAVAVHFQGNHWIRAFQQIVEVLPDQLIPVSPGVEVEVVGIEPRPDIDAREASAANQRDDHPPQG
jgi:hypothetical protein